MSIEGYPLQNIINREGALVGRYRVIEPRTQSPEVPNYELYVYDLSDTQRAVFTEQGCKSMQLESGPDGKVGITNASGDTIEVPVNRILPLSFAVQAVETLLENADKKPRELWYDFAERINEVAKGMHRPASHRIGGAKPSEN